MSVRDFRKHFDRADLLREIESVKENPQYSSLLSYFNISAGINPLINKFPLSFLEKWVASASKYKKIHNLVFSLIQPIRSHKSRMTQASNMRLRSPKLSPIENNQNGNLVNQPITPQLQQTKLTFLSVFLKIINYAPYM